MARVLRSFFPMKVWVMSMLVATSCAALAADEPAAVTTADASIPAEELALLLKPLSKDELLTEAAEWQRIVKGKAEQIARAEIAVRRQNAEIERANAIKEKAREASDNLQEVADKVSEARRSGDESLVADAKQAATDAKESIQEMGQAIDETVEKVEESAEARKALGEGGQRSLEETAQAAAEAEEAATAVEDAVTATESKDDGDRDAAAVTTEQAASEAKEAVAEVAEKLDETLDNAQTASDEAAALEKVEARVEQAEEEKRAEKIDLLEQLGQLREERTRLIDSLRAVIDELEAKTDAADSDTLAKIKDYRLYIRSVSGINVDVTDTVSAWVALKSWLTSAEGGLRWLFNLGSFVSILVLAWFVAKILSSMVGKALGRLTMPALLRDFATKSVRWAVIIVGIISALAALEISVAPLLAMVGAAGFIIAFAMQDSLSNFASGLMILFFRPFDIGDVVDAGGVSGKVSSMNLVSTTIRTFDNKLMVVPNSRIWSDVITNATGVTERRVDMEFGIGYDDDIDLAQKILEEIVNAHPKVLDNPEPTIKMSALADSSVNFICRPWSRPADYWDVYWDVTREVKKRFDAAGIGIPFPQRDVHLYIEKGREGDLTA